MSKTMRDADLKVDVDTHKAHPIWRFNFRFRMLCAYFPAFSGSQIRVCRTRKGYHFYVYLPQGRRMVSASGIIAVQAILGSDWLRELRNLDRAMKGDAVWNVLFNVKTKNGRTYRERHVSTYRIGNYAKNLRHNNTG